MSKPTQNERVLARLRKGPLTAMEAMTELGVMRLGARILELKQDGHPIDAEMVDVPTRVPGEHARVARYRLAPCTHPRAKPQGDRWGTTRCPDCGLVTAPPFQLTPPEGADHAPH